MCNVVPIFRPEVVKGGVSPELQSALSQVIAEGRFIKGCEVAAFEKELCSEPVSYTHLDVYKRQQLQCLTPHSYICKEIA